MKARVANWAALGLFLAVFLTVYSPVLHTDYAFLDDYHDLAGGPHGWSITKKMREGRPLYALATRLFLQSATHIEDLRYARFVGVVGIGLVAWLVFLILTRSGWSRFQAFCVGVIIGSSLPFQVCAAWASVALYPFAALVSGLAFLLGEGAFATHRRARQWLLAAGSVLVLLAALTLHQTAAMFFWVCAAIVVLKPDTPLGDMLRRLRLYLLIGMAGLLLGFGVYALAAVVYPGYPARTGLVQDIPAKVVWFCGKALPNALHFVLLSPGYWILSGQGSAPSPLHRSVDVGIAWAMAGLIPSGLLLYFRGTWRERCGKLGLAGALLPLSYAPNLVVAENWASYRSLLSLTALVIVYAFLALRGYALRWRHSKGESSYPVERKAKRCTLSPVWANAAAGGVASVCAMLATWQVQTSVVTPQVRELGFMGSQLMQGNLAQAGSIYVVRPRWQDTLAPPAHYEFGLPSSFPDWNPPAMVSLLLRELAPDSAHLPITSVAAEAPIKPPPGSLVVDMRLSRLSPAANGSATEAGPIPAGQ